MAALIAGFGVLEYYIPSTIFIVVGCGGRDGHAGRTHVKAID